MPSSPTYQSSDEASNSEDLIESGRLLDDEYDEEGEDTKTFLQGIDDALTLSRTERLYGFLICFILGWLIQSASVYALPSIVIKPNRFAVLYTAGNIISLCSTMFLFGPWKQLRSMFEETRRMSTIVYLFSMMMTFFFAFRMHSVPGVLFWMFIQFVSDSITSCSFSLLVFGPKPPCR